MQVQTTWNYSLDTEADRIIQAAANTFNGFYPRYDFLVLPRLIPSANLIYLPKLACFYAPSFIPKVSRLNLLKIPVTTDPRLIKPVKAELSAKFPSRKNAPRLLKSDWQKKEKRFWETAVTILPKSKKHQVNLEIRPTVFGSTSSFSLPTENNQNLQLCLYVRLDQSPAAIAEAILSALIEFFTSPQKGLWENNWEENEAIVDFLLEHSNLAGLFPNYQATLAGVRQKQNANLVQESQNYLKKLGVSTKEIFALDQNKIRVKGKRPKTRFTKNESLVLALLIRQKNLICTIDQIAEQVWEKQTEERFSPWAIAKLIERLRRKLQAEGLSPALIQACRGQGYLLKD